MASKSVLRCAFPVDAAMRGLACLLLAAMLAGCGGRVTGVLGPTPVSEPGARSVTVFTATTRERSAVDDGTLFTGERGPGLAFREITVSIPPTHKAGEIEWPEALPANPATDFVTTDIEVLEQGTVRKTFRDYLRRTGKRHVLIFVHGYNNTFEDAVYRGVQIVADSGADVTPVLFTWPSRARLLAYSYDRESANYSRDALEALLQALAKDRDVSEVSILAHSMGNWVTLEALRTMAIRDGRVHPKIADVMLAAPDVDVDVAATQIRSMGKPLPRFTLFVSKDDRALAAARIFWGSEARLGAIDPTIEPYRSGLERNGITVVDLTNLEGTDSLNHGKFAESPEVVQLIGTRLASGQEVGGGKVGFGGQLTLAVTGASMKVGTAAGTVITAPLAVVDESARAIVMDSADESGILILKKKKPVIAPPLEDVAVE
jgi:esterase/lipase superfamily enzyme